MISLFKKCILLDMVCGNTEYNPCCWGMYPLLTPWIFPKNDDIVDFVKEVKELRKESFAILHEMCQLDMKKVFNRNKIPKDN